MGRRSSWDLENQVHNIRPSMSILQNSEGNFGTFFMAPDGDVILSKFSDFVTSPSWQSIVIAYVSPWRRSASDVKRGANSLPPTTFSLRMVQGEIGNEKISTSLPNPDEVSGLWPTAFQTMLRNCMGTLNFKHSKTFISLWTIECFACDPKQGFKNQRYVQHYPKWSTRRRQN